MEVGAAYENVTLRQIVRISIGGDRVRVRLSNRFGSVPLVIDAASVGIRDLGLGMADLGGGFVLGPVVDADEIIAGYKHIINRAHNAGLKILIGTVLPFKGFALPGYWSPENEAKRQQVNAWIRSSDLHDGLVDFDAAIRDPDDPERMFAVFDGGDGLHPSAAGYERMAAEAAKALLSRGKGHKKHHD